MQKIFFIRTYNLRNIKRSLGKSKMISSEIKSTKNGKYASKYEVIFNILKYLVIINYLKQNKIKQNKKTKMVL